MASIIVSESYIYNIYIYIYIYRVVSKKRARFSVLSLKNGHGSLAPLLKTGVLIMHSVEVLFVFWVFIVSHNE